MPTATPKQSRQKSRMAPQKHGGALKIGGTNPGAGRPPDEFKARMREIASGPTALAFLEQCVNGEHGAQFAIKAQEYAAERGYGRVPQSVALTGDEGGPIRIIVERDG